MIEIQKNKAIVADGDSEHETYERERIRRANEADIRAGRVDSLCRSARAHFPLFGRR